MLRTMLFMLMSLLVLAVASGQGFPQGDRPLAPARDGVLAGHPPSSAVSCGYPQVSLSPDGEMFLLMSNANFDFPLPMRFGDLQSATSVEGVHLVGSACFLRGGLSQECLVGRIEVPAGVAIAWWSQDSRHVFANGGGRMAGFKIDPVARRVTMVGEPRNDLNAWYPSLAVAGPTPSTSSEQEWQRFRDALGWLRTVTRPAVGDSPFSLMRVTLRPDGMSASGTLRGSLDLGVIESAPTGIAMPTGYRVTSFGGEERPMVVSDEAGHLWAVGEGEAIRRAKGAVGASARWQQGPRPRLFGKRPILDSSSGRLLGVHTEREIVWALEAPVLEGFRASVMRALPKDAVLHAVEYSRKSDVAIVTFYQVNVGLTRLVFARDSRSGRWRSGGTTCPSTSGDRGQPLLTVRGYDAGERDWPVMARHYSREGSRRLVVLLHGGPSRSVLYDDVGLWMVRSGSLSGKSEDLVSYDPSGSGGVDATVADRLAVFGGAALERDADFIARDVLRLAKSYDEVVLQVSSYGGALLPDVASRLGDRMIRAYVTAPLMQHRGYEDLRVEQGHDRLMRNSGSFKDTFQRLYYGLDRVEGEKRFDVWLRDRYRQFRPDHRFVFVFGTLDELSRPTDLPNPGSARLVVLEGGHHVPHTELGPLCWVSGDCPPGTFQADGSL